MQLELGNSLLGSLLLSSKNLIDDFTPEGHMAGMATWVNGIIF